MKDVQFYSRYDNIAGKVLAYDKNFSSMTTPQRLINKIQNQEEMNKLFVDKIQSEFLGKNIDTTA